MIRFIVNLLSLVLITQSVFSQEISWSDVSFLKPTNLKISVDTFDDPIQVDHGKVKEGFEGKPYFRLLESTWATYLDPKITKENYLTYFYGDSEKKKTERIEALKRSKETYPNKESILQTDYAKKYGTLYVRGCTLVSQQGKIYCILDYSYKKEPLKGETIAIFGIFDDEKWKLLDSKPKFLNYGPMPWTSSSSLKESTKTGYMLYNESTNSFNPVSVKEK